MAMEYRQQHERHLKRRLEEQDDHLKEQLKEVQSAAKGVMKHFGLPPSQLRFRYVKTSRGPYASWYEVRIKNWEEETFPQELRQWVNQQINGVEQASYGTVQPTSIAISGRSWIKLLELLDTPDPEGPSFVEVGRFEDIADVPEYPGLDVLDWTDGSAGEASRFGSNAYVTQQDGEYVFYVEHDKARELGLTD